MTPWQFYKIHETWIKTKEQEHEHDTWIMWHGALLPKLKKFPDLKDFKVKKQVKNIDEAAIMARLKAYSKRVKECQS